MKQVQIQCVGNSYQGYINSLKWDQVDPQGYANARQWYYQTCTEFGYCKCLFFGVVTFLFKSQFKLLEA